MAEDLRTYQLTSDKLKGSIEVAYKDGQLKAVEFILKEPLTLKQYTFVMVRLPYSDEQLESKMAPLKVQAKEKLPTNKKIALFCEQYERRTGVKYKVSPAESGKIKLVDVNENLLNTYFSSDNFLFKDRYSISNYVKYYNELRAEANRPAGAVQYPNYYSADFVKKLDGPGMQAYYAHLRAQGLEAVKSTTGSVINFEKPKS